MSRKQAITYIALVFIICISYLAIMVRVNLGKERKANIERCHIFVDDIKKGMSLTEVEVILNNIGKYDSAPLEVNGLTTINIHFKEKSIWERFNSDVILYFENGQYTHAEIPTGLGEFKSVCIR